MHASDVTHEPSGLSPGNTGQLPFEFWIPKRNCIPRSWALWNSGPRAMHARAVGSRAGCDDDDKAAHAPLGNCFCANNPRRSWTETSLVVTMALLYCRLPNLSNCVRRKLIDSYTGCANAPKEECRRVRHPKCEWRKFATAVSGNVRTASPLARPPPKVHTAKKCPSTHRDPEGERRKGSVATQIAYNQEFS